jgi:hypothetical protein
MSDEKCIYKSVDCDWWDDEWCECTCNKKHCPNNQEEDKALPEEPK